MVPPLTAETVTFKVLVLGSFGIGKTTLIQQISEVPVVGTEVATSGHEAAVKPTTTVGIEYGIFSVCDEDLRVTLLLFGTPGQDRFTAARDVAAQGVDGLIIIIDADDRATWETGRRLCDAYNPSGDIPTVWAVNRWPGEVEAPPGLESAVRGRVVSELISCGEVIDPYDVRRFLIDLLTLILQTELDDEEGE